MHLKRKYDAESLQRWQNDHGHKSQEMRDRIEKPQVSHIEVLSASREWKVSDSVIEKGVREGWLTLGDGRVTLKTGAADVVYRIMRLPGHYCCFCEEKIEDDGRGTQARKHIVMHTLPSPDANNPSGWRKDNFYFCVLESGIEPKTSGREPATRGFLARLLGR